jgi:hypothetical protein
LNKLPVKTPAVPPSRRRVPIKVWQTLSWTKKIVSKNLQRKAAEKARILGG